MVTTYNNGGAQDSLTSRSGNNVFTHCKILLEFLLQLQLFLRI